MRRRLQEIGWKGQAFVVRHPNAKDPTELHKLDPSGFLEALHQAKEQAVPLSEVEPAPSRAGLILLSDVQPEKVSWLWPGRIPLGKLTVADGEPRPREVNLHAGHTRPGSHHRQADARRS